MEKSEGFIEFQGLITYSFEEGTLSFHEMKGNLQKISSFVQHFYTDGPQQSEFQGTGQFYALQ